MSKETAIQYAHSSMNLMMGCEGCELWNKSEKTCYAGTQTERYGGKKGWPKSFGEPMIFPERMSLAERWKELTPEEREEKPWMPADYPRVIFLNDMGDTFTAKLDRNWLAEYLARIAATPHVYLVLTKRPSRFAAFAAEFDLPDNIWPGTTVTTQSTLPRIDHLKAVRGGGPKWVSVEPMREAIDFKEGLAGIAWAVFGGESRQTQQQELHALDLMWLAGGIRQCRQYGVSPFVKQLGSAPYFSVLREATVEKTAVSLKLRDPHGGNWSEWPEELRVREMPTIHQLTTPPLL